MYCWYLKYLLCMENEELCMYLLIEEGGVYGKDYEEVYLLDVKKLYLV